MPYWGDLTARTRGLATHLHGRARLETLAGAASVEQFASILATFDPRVPQRPDLLPQDLDLYFRRVAADHLATMARWSGPRIERLAVLFEDEDRRSIRALVRGAVQRIAPEQRQAGLIPTPSLPVAALGELARCSTPAEVARLLGNWTNPYAAALLPEAKKHQPDLLLLESGINTTFAARATAGARRGGRHLKRFVQRVVDLENIWSVAVLAERGGDPNPERFYAPGGLWLTAETYREAAQSEEWRTILKRVFRESPLAAVLDQGEESVPLESRSLVVLLLESAREALLDPLGSAPLLSFVLRLRAELLDLRSIVWGIMLGVDRHRLEAGLISRW